MEVPFEEGDGKSQTITVLITGANSGLGFSTCCRLIDEFLLTRPQSQNLHIIFSTRDTKKGEDTLKRLNAHLQTTLKEANAQSPGISLLLEPRIKLEGVLVDLLKLVTVKALAQQLLARNQHIDVLIWNAGIAGWLGVNYPKATWDIIRGLIDATTYPKFMICDVGLLANRQIPIDEETGASPEPPLGQLFTANVFGHYLLTHWLLPLMDAETRIILLSSTSAIPSTFNPDDLQGLQSNVAYEHSKRLTDILVLTSDLPSTQPYVQAFLSTSKSPPSKSQRPQIYLTHPGVVATSINGLTYIMSLVMLAALYIARWVGSPWHPISPYKGAVSAVFAALAPPSQLADLELSDGKGKWGTATDVFGNERVVRTEIEGWGFGGDMGSVPSGSLASKRRGHQQLTREMREEFEETGRRVWRELEELRVEWEKRLGWVEIDDRSLVDA